MTKIAFVEYTYPESGVSRDGAFIYTVNADGTGKTRLAALSFDNERWIVSAYELIWSPSGNQIALSGYDSQSASFEILVMNADGSDLRPVTNTLADEGSPVWSPDGAKIAFVSTRDGHMEIYLMNADGTGQTRLTASASNNSSPAWSPDGQKIAFVSARDGYPEIYVMNADGTGQTRLTNHAGADRYPTWSPDGKQIAFVRYRDMDQHGHYVNDSIYVMNADGTEQSPVTSVGTFHSVQQPKWSPDGGKIAFIGQNHMYPFGALYVMNPDGSDLTYLAGGQWNTMVQGHSWSPDGRRIVFLPGGGGAGPFSHRIYTINVNGTDLMNISSIDIAHTSASWNTKLVSTWKPA